MHGPCGFPGTSIKFLILSLLVFSQGPDLRCDEPADDDWGTLEAFAEESPSPEDAPAGTNAVSVDIVPYAETGCGFSLKNSGGLPELYRDDVFRPVYHSLLSGVRLHGSFRKAVSFDLDLALSASDKRNPGASAGSGTSSGSRSADLHAGIERLTLGGSLADVLFFSAGIRKQADGNSPYFNPASVTDRYVDNPSLPGRASFPFVELSVPFGEHWLSTRYLPGFSVPDGFFSNGLPFFRADYDANIILLKASLLFSDYAVDLLCPLIEKTPRNGTFYSGFGASAVLPFTEFFLVELQGLYANGKARRRALPVDGFPGVSILSQDPLSCDGFLPDASVTASVKPSERLTLKTGYRYDGRGLSEADWDAITGTVGFLKGSGRDSVLREPAALSFSGLLYSTLPFQRHTLLAAIESSGLVPGLNAAAVAFVSLPDCTSQLYVVTDYRVNDTLSFFVKSGLTVSPPGGRSGFFAERAFFELGIKTNKD